MKGIVASINQTYITLETGRILPHSKWQLPSPKPANHCTNCNSYDSSVPDSSPWKFCLSKGKYTKEEDLKTCNDFKPIIPYKGHWFSLIVGLKTLPDKGLTENTKLKEFFPS